MNDMFPEINKWMDRFFFLIFIIFVLVFAVLPHVFPLKRVNNSGSGWLEKRKACLERLEVKE